MGIFHTRKDKRTAPVIPIPSAYFMPKAIDQTTIDRDSACTNTSPLNSRIHAPMIWRCDTEPCTTEASHPCRSRFYRSFLAAPSAVRKGWTQSVGQSFHWPITANCSPLRKSYSWARQICEESLWYWSQAELTRWRKIMQHSLRRIGFLCYNVPPENFHESRRCQKRA